MTKKEKNQQNTTEPEEINLEDIFGKVAAAWEFSEYIKHEKSKVWYISFTVVFLAMLVYSYFSDNLLFAIILLVFAVVYLSLEKKDPINVQVALAEDGLLINDKFMEWKQFANFYIIYYPPEITNLYLQPKNNFKQRITIPLEDQDPVTIREFLLRYMDEDLEKEEMPASEGISRLLKL
ncbi:hypothetical protein KKH39_02355 [Patescibacteria group bacterium]|nr:hypothetical protein [Patescibacteria group bacterium]